LYFFNNYLAIPEYALKFVFFNFILKVLKRHLINLGTRQNWYLCKRWSILKGGHQVFLFFRKTEGSFEPSIVSDIGDFSQPLKGITLIGSSYIIYRAQTSLGEYFWKKWGAWGVGGLTLGLQ
jgi:hypothetical protein